MFPEQSIRPDKAFRDPQREPPQAHLGYRPTQVAAYTGLPTPTVYRACERGDIRHTRIGRAYIIPGSEVLRLIGAAP